LHSQAVPVARARAAAAIVEAAKEAHLRESGVRAAHGAPAARASGFAQSLGALPVRREEALPLRLVGARAAAVLLPQRLGAALVRVEPDEHAAGEVAALEVLAVDELDAEVQRELALAHAPAVRVSEVPALAA